MKVNFYLSNDPVHRRVVEAMFEGCPEDKFLRSMKYDPSEVACVFGVYKKRVPISAPRGQVIRLHREHENEVIICETGYLKRGDGEDNYYAAGLNGLNGRADFRNENMPSDRFEKLGIQVKPWRKSGDHVLVCGQIPWDASVDHIDFKQWKLDTVERLRKLTDREIVFRQHPLLGGLSRPLSEDLIDCWAVVTFNSNSAVEAAIQGIPVFAEDAGSMAMPVANVDLSTIETPVMPDREQWLNNLSYAQWTPEEMRNGEAWRHLFR